MRTLSGMFRAIREVEPGVIADIVIARLINGADMEDCYYALGRPIPRRLTLWAKWYDSQ